MCSTLLPLPAGIVGVPTVSSLSHKHTATFIVTKREAWLISQFVDNLHRLSTKQNMVLFHFQSGPTDTIRSVGKRCLKLTQPDGANMRTWQSISLIDVPTCSKESKSDR